MKCARVPVAAMVFSFLLVFGPSRDGFATVYDFTTGAGVDRFAFGTGIPQISVPPLTASLPSSPLSAADYAALGASDDLRYSTGVIEGGSFAATRFVFTLTEPGPSVTQLDILWEGGADQDKGQRVWLWNASTASYVPVGSQAVIPPPDGMVSGSFTTNASDFVAADNTVTILVNYDSSGGSLFTDYVSLTVTRTAPCNTDADCDDGLFCSGSESCDPVAGCQPGTPVNCDDGLVCTIDSCNEQTDSCDNLPTDCNDGLFCNGSESCDPVAGCQPGVPINCDDGVPCTVDSCNESSDSCNNVPDNTNCGNGLFCDGTETCDPLLNCQPGTPVNCDDGVPCTVDSCNETTDYCDNIPNDPTCIIPTRWYVDDTATAANDGTSWANAMTQLQDALAAAVYGDEVWVAGGIYKPDLGGGEVRGDANASFRLRNGVALYGHFLGTEATLGERDLSDMADPLRQTILSGDIGVIAYNLDNVYHVVTGSGTDSSALLDGFTVTGGHAPLYGMPRALGGGMLIDTGSPTVINCTFTGNAAGGGGGAGIYSGNPTFTNCTFANNQADAGGGMYNLYGSPAVSDSVFSSNRADEKGGGMADMFGTASLTNCEFTGNSTPGQVGMGGGMYINGSAGFLARPTVTNCLFSGNSAVNGGGILSYGAPIITNCTFAANSALAYVGGLYHFGGSATIANSVFWGNSQGMGTPTGESAQILGNVSINYSAVEGWSGALGGVGNTGGDPLFADPATGDYRLTPGSVCIDAGNSGAVPSDVFTDLDGRPRLLDDPATPDTGAGLFPIVDMGAYEFAASCTTSADCDDGKPCNGTEICDASGTCQPGIPQGCTAELAASPPNLDLRPAPGQTAPAQITVANTGTAGTHWSLLVITPAPANQAAAMVTSTMAKGPAAAVDWNAPHQPNTLLVAFKKPSHRKRTLAAPARASIHASLGTTRIHSLSRIPVDVVQVPAGTDLRTKAAQYAALPEVDYVEPNYLVRPLLTPDDPSFSALWALHNTGQAGGTPDADIDAPEAWDMATGNQQVIVAVIDTGIDYNHPDLAPNMWTNGSELNGVAGVDDDGNGIIDDVYGARWTSGTGLPTSGDPYDDHFHGTHVAGTIGAAGNNALGVAGINWNVRLMALKFLSAAGSGYVSDAIAALDYAVAMGARISNNSWGGGGYSQALKDAIDAAGAAGHLFVAAAGNNGTDNDAVPAYPASYNSATILSVAATDRNDLRSWFSNWGATSVDLAAPGSDILSTSPGGGYITLSGTSMATPHVTGVAALLLAEHPTMSVSNLKQKILDSVDPIPAMAGLTVTGGRLNAAKALAGVAWLAASPTSGSLNPGESVLINVTADATNLVNGFAGSAILRITSDASNSPLNVPVTISVGQCSTDADCDDGLFCNGTETCDTSGACRPGIPMNCDDAVSCTTDSCNEATGSCDHVPNDSLCSDGRFCDGVETCDASLDCQPGAPVNCDDAIPCTTDSCNEAIGSCEHAAKDSLCSDGNACTLDTCDAAAGCQHTNAADGLSCSDGNLCNGKEVCQGGQCTSGTPLDCNDGNVCTDDSCQPATGCVNTPNSAPCNDGDACTSADTCSGGICAGTPGPGPCLDYFLCYRTRSREDIQVRLSDAFDSGDYRGNSARVFCTPAGRDGAGTVDPSTHLTSYRIRGPHVRRSSIEVVNQFGSFFFDTRKTASLMVPSTKSLAPDPPPDPPGAAIQVDHYRCLSVVRSAGTTSFPRTTHVTIADQFGSRTVYIKKPSKLCLPVDKNGEGIKNPEVHLMCYKIKTAPRIRVTGVQIDNQFGQRILTLNRENELCVPSLVNYTP